MDHITRDTLVETILEIPGAIAYGIQNGVSFFTCSGGYPCSLGKLLADRGIADPEGFIAGLNAHLETKSP
ncbi:hypothetical protein [Desulfolutivibrio sulfoxidireducens]|uniref:hypothetical protein n=1 Tax=Desulfolutivibrio sulfoxidireducens TaxID=2773299 RepID=UPI00159D3E1E|nr:hypothetical protein [Desulfolutivibrio sulfoxidireducens]QLA14799.1 hypothetical protein GD605_00890 [Desulfolutivibrio sulfoxidireducens]QLA18371.1 hypothetical protein GD604_00830 [Desulfolutivibrio sulfoxidireducens]